jgi:2-polyprenyl-6-hydroxyphenyl methylase/3-demethylubiquinone-9 3-methyltransferase
VVEHLYAPRALPQRVWEALKPGGIAIITTPYHGYWKNLAICLLNKWDSHHTVFWDHGHIKFWSKTTLRKLFEDEGFEFLKFQGLGRLPYLWMTMLMVFRKPEEQS